jgi:hypothetical protein
MSFSVKADEFSAAELLAARLHPHQ